MSYRKLLLFVLYIGIITAVCFVAISFLFLGMFLVGFRSIDEPGVKPLGWFIWLIIGVLGLVPVIATVVTARALGGTSRKMTLKYVGAGLVAILVAFAAFVAVGDRI